MSAKYDIALNKNEDFTLFVKYLDDSDNPVNLSNHEAEMMIKRYVREPEYLFFLKAPYDLLPGISGGTGGISLNRNENNTAGETGGIYLNLNSEVLTKLTNTTNVYDLFIINTIDGKKSKLLEGNIVVNSEV